MTSNIVGRKCGEDPTRQGWTTHDPAADTMANKFALFIYTPNYRNTHPIIPHRVASFLCQTFSHYVVYKYYNPANTTASSSSLWLFGRCSSLRLLRVASYEGEERIEVELPPNNEYPRMNNRNPPPLPSQQNLILAKRRTSLVVRFTSPVTL